VGFVNVQEGDLLITPPGQAYAEASILARKELITGRILHLPVISWIYETLRRDDNQRVARSHFVDELKPDFGDLMEKQFDIAISWGLYDELFVYHDDAGELYLKS
jgi:NitT/TauT family transport system ATP-binding protein